MLDSRDIPQISAAMGTIQGLPKCSDDVKRLLIAAVYALADEFSDITFEEIDSPENVSPGILDFFCSCVKHHWASEGGGPISCSGTHEAINCPFKDAEIISIIRRFERKNGLLWNPAKAKRARSKKAS